MFLRRNPFDPFDFRYPVSSNKANPMNYRVNSIRFSSLPGLGRARPGVRCEDRWVLVRFPEHPCSPGTSCAGRTDHPIPADVPCLSRFRCRCRPSRRERLHPCSSPFAAAPASSIRKPGLRGLRAYAGPWRRFEAFRFVVCGTESSSWRQPIKNRRLCL